MSSLFGKSLKKGLSEAFNMGVKGLEAMMTGGIY
jgi:hypothetical protein